MNKLTRLGLLLGLSAVPAVAAATQYSNTANGTYTEYMYTYTTAYGNLMTLPSTQVLQSYSFYLRQATNSTPGNIDLEITQWDPTANGGIGAAVGPIVYASPTPSYWNATDQALTFNNINTTLQGGVQYAIYMTLATPGSSSASFINNYANYISAYYGTATSVNDYIVWSNSNGIDPLYDPSAWNNGSNWYGPGQPANFLFSMTTSTAATTAPSAAVPAPEGVGLALFGILGLGALTMRRRRV